MSKITINRENFDGNNIKIDKGKVTIDGNEEDVNLSNGIDLKMQTEGEEQSADVTINGSDTTIHIHQTSKTGENKMSISF